MIHVLLCWSLDFLVSVGLEFKVQQMSRNRKTVPTKLLPARLAKGPRAPKALARALARGPRRRVVRAQRPLLAKAQATASVAFSQICLLSGF